MSEQEHNPVIGFATRFAFGAAFGVLLGLYCAANADPGDHPLLIVATVAIVCGVAAAAFGDRFWHSLAWWV
jgi:hypothetical protein